MEPLIYKYGLLDPLDWGPDCSEQLYRNNRLWNNLVEIERAQRKRYLDLVDSQAEVFQMKASRDALWEERKTLIKQRKKAAQSARRRVDVPEITNRLRQIKTELDATKDAFKAARAAAALIIKPEAEKLDSERKEAVKKARNASGLWWGNYNAVCADYNTARYQPGELQLHRFTGEGRFVVQIINGASVEEITSGRKQVQLALSPQEVPGRQGKHRPRLAITIYTTERESRWLTFPIVYDRPLPPDARVQQVTVTRRKLGTRYRYEAIFLLKVESVAAPTRNDGKTVAINFGFRQTDDGLRTATSFDGEKIEYLMLDDRWLNEMTDVEDIRSARDRILNEFRQTLLLSWVNRPHPEPEFAGRLSDLISAPKCASASLAAVVLAWRGCADWWPEMFEKAEAWRKFDKRQLEIEANKRSHLIAARGERQRLYARSIAQRYSTIKLGAIELDRIAQRDNSDGEENELHKAARRNRVLASVSSLRREIIWQAKKHGAIVETVDGPFTRTCHVCATEHGPIGPELNFSCTCGETWDQDTNAARNIFAWPGERANEKPARRKRSRMKKQQVSEETSSSTVVNHPQATDALANPNASDR